MQRQLVPTNDLYGVVGRMQEALFRQGQVMLTQVGPTSWLGKGPEVGLGFVVKATLIAMPLGPTGYAMDLKLEAELEDKGLLLLGASWVVCLPIAPILFFVAWRDCQARQSALQQAAWSAAATSFAGASFSALPPGAPGW